MTILAICGPIGSDFKTTSEQIFSLLDTENTLLIDSTALLDEHSLLSLITDPLGDVIIFGADLFLAENLRAKLDIIVFLELDPDLCLSNYLTLLNADSDNLGSLLDYYFSTIQPLNEKLRESAKFATLIRPQLKLNDKIIELVVNKAEKKLNNVTTYLSDSQIKAMFWKPVAHQLNPVIEAINETTQEIKIS
jgi:uridine kinase